MLFADSFPRTKNRIDMNNYFSLISKAVEDKTLKKTLEANKIVCFNELFEKYADDVEKIINYVNEVYNYNSPYLIEEKDWGGFLRERFYENDINELLYNDITCLAETTFVLAVDCFLSIQENRQFQTITAKEGLRKQLLSFIQKSGNTTSDNKNANEMINDLDEEINLIHEQMRNDQKVFGNHKGYEAVKRAKQLTEVNIAML